MDDREADGRRIHALVERFTCLENEELTEAFEKPQRISESVDSQQTSLALRTDGNIKGLHETHQVWMGRENQVRLTRR